jgi:starch-binding outer membrane protein, SusD/RagB family
MKHIAGTFLCFFFITLTSCKKSYLDGAVSTTIPFREGFISDLKSCESYLNGIYVSVGDYLFHGLNTVYPELVADNVKPFPGNSTLIQHYVWSQTVNSTASLRPTSAHRNLNSLYMSCYYVIRSCNFLLESVERFRGENSQLADNMKGQLFAIRGWVHHILVNTFAQPYGFSADASHPGVPYITDVDYNLPSPLKRETVEATYERIIADLKQGIDFLKVNSPSGKFYMSQTAAKAILARVYLFKGYFDQAKDLALEVCAVIPIMAAGDYPSKLFTLEDAMGSEESIFYLPPASGTYNTVFSSGYFRQTPRPVYLATADIKNLLTESVTDKRNAWVTASGANWLITKFPVGSFPDISDPNRSYCQPVIRSSELILTAAESYANLGDENNARLYLDMIRHRADATALSSSASGPALLDSIYKERRKELAFEGLRMFDLLRTGQGVIRTDAPDPNAVALPYPSGKAIAPLPFNEVYTGSIAQNPDY